MVKFREKNWRCWSKEILDTSGLVTTTVLNIKMSEVEKKIQNTSSLVTTTVLDTKISETESKVPNHGKYITTPEFNNKNFAARLKQDDLEQNWFW